MPDVLTLKFTSTIMSSFGHRCFRAVCGEGQRRRGFGPVKMKTFGSVPIRGRIGIQPFSSASFM